MNEKQRLAAIAHAAFLIANADRIGYEFGGGLDWIDQSMAGFAKRFAAGQTWDPDCRATILWVCRWSGWHSPTGEGWAGGSSAMWQHLPHFSDVSTVLPGSLVAYGVDGDAHVAMVMHPDGDDPWLFSHGSASGPKMIRYSDETKWHRDHGHPVTLLAVGQL